MSILKKFKNYATRIYVWTTKQNNLTYIFPEYILYWILFISPYMRIIIFNDIFFDIPITVALTGWPLSRHADNRRPHRQISDNWLAGW